MALTIQGFVMRLVISVLILVLYNIIEGRAGLKPEQARAVGIIVLIVTLAFLLFGGYLFASLR